MENFIDTKTGEKFLIPSHKTFIRQGRVLNVDKQGKELVNPKNGNPLTSIPKEGIPTQLYSQNKEGMKAMLKKRATKHYEKEIKETRYQMNKDLIKNFEDK